MRKRISVLVAIGFAFLLGLGVLTSLAMIAGLRETMSRAEASQASALEVRASVRSLRADYLASGDAVSRLMLEPSLVDAWAAKREADANADEHLASAARATRRGDLRAVLERLEAHDREVTNRIEDELLGLVATDPAEAKRAYFEEYLRARAANLDLVDQALRLATAEVAEAARYTDAKARQTIGLAWLALALFVVVGASSGILLSRSVRKIARDFEDAAAEVGDQRDRLRAMMDEVEAARDAALEASRIKSEFLANMSHEIRTPMNAIIGFTDLVLETTLAPDQRDYLGHVRQSSDALLAIINEVLDLSKIEAGRMRLERTPFSVRRTLGAALSGMAIRADEKHIELAVDVGPHVPDAVIGDASRMRQVLVNLVGNAIKFTEQGHVVVHVTTESDAGDEEVVLHFSVADTGIGIPPDKHRLVFEAFTQGDGSMTRRYDGTGLGLTIASRFVEMMGGRIWLESAVGRGSTFHFTARVERQQPASNAATLPETIEAPVETGNGEVPVADVARPEPACEPLRVLVVEDNPTNRRMLTVLLETRGHAAVPVEDGLQAIAALQGGSFDVVLMDVQMPRMDGLTATSGIRAREKASGGHLPIIALTAHAMKGDRERCIAAGMDAYVSKPVRAEELFGVMEAVVGKARAMESDAGGSDASSVDVDAVLRQVGGNRAALAELLDLFRKDSACLLDAVRAALATRDGSALERTAHQLRGALLMMAAPGAADAAMRLEEIGREQDFRSAPEAWTRLTDEIDRLGPRLAALGERAKEDITG